MRTAAVVGVVHVTGAVPLVTGAAPHVTGAAHPVTGAAAHASAAAAARLLCGHSLLWSIDQLNCVSSLLTVWPTSSWASGFAIQGVRVFAHALLLSDDIVPVQVCNAQSGQEQVTQTPSMCGISL
jgi:hypothetical protein